VWKVTAFDHTGREVASLEAASGEITIGRESDRRLVLPSPSVSRRHAKLVLDGDEPLIVDEGSANGVQVDGVRIVQATPVTSDTRVDIAEYHITVALVRSAGASARDDDDDEPERPAPRDEQAEPSGATAATLRLVAEGGPFDGRSFELPPGRVSVGRAVDNDLVFDDPSLSRKHAVMEQVGPDSIEIEDLNSSNGTYLNGRKVDKGTAAVGDLVRLGELIFRVEGEATTHRPAVSFALPVVGRVPKSALLYGGIGLGAFVVLVGVGLALSKSKPAAPPAAAKDSIAHISEQAASHLQAGKDRLAARDWDAAATDFQQALDLDPANAEARRLKAFAQSEPQSEKTASRIRALLKLPLDRGAVEKIRGLLGQIPSESAFHDPSAREVAAKLASQGQAQCRGRHWADCVWSICKAREVAPPGTRGPAFSGGAESALREAEKKMGHRGAPACKSR
jgi:pSer/pThr/pTyr-binding forkhead associated (FHA) protein